MSALATAVNSGKALYAGLSNYPLDRLKEAVAILKDMGIRCLIYQPPYSLFRRGVEASGTLDYLLEEGIGTAVFSPLAQGMLTPKYLAGIPEDSRAASASPFLQPDQVLAQQATLRALGELAAQAGMPLHHFALKWVLRTPAVTTAIIGARTVAQLDDSLVALAEPPLTEDILAAADAITPLTNL
jgi:L-glyceraldehyde 3-phosphate reductase